MATLTTTINTKEQSEKPSTVSEPKDEEVSVPEPKGLPLLGNITSIDPEFPLGSMTSLADQYGKLLGKTLDNHRQLSSLNRRDISVTLPWSHNRYCFDPGFGE